MYPTIAELLETLPHQEFVGSKTVLRRRVRGFSTDSRTVKQGEVFLALHGENFNGHEFVPTVGDKGAVLAIVSEEWMRARKDEAGVPLIAVRDPLEAYGRIATVHRRKFSYPVIAVAGSNGKTTTKELITDVLSSRYNVLKTEGNLNNLIGVPATMLRMTEHHTAAVVEIGTNSPGEIAKLCEILEPTHGIITNVGREHLELLKTIEGVAEEEGALFRYLGKKGMGFVNRDDEQVVRVSRPLGRKLTYGRHPNADIHAEIELKSSGMPSVTLQDQRKSSRPITFQLKTPGPHTGLNAVAAAAVGIALRIPRGEIKEKLEAFEPHEYHAGYARLRPMRAMNGAVILNDTYNANPDSMVAAFDTLASMQTASDGRRIVVLGDMRELGSNSAAEHRRVGELLARSGHVDLAFFVGDEMKKAHEVIAGTQRSSLASFHFRDKARVVDELRKVLKPEDLVLVKGSRGMRMEEVVAGITS